MGFKFRKSIKLAPGVKLNLGKNSIGLSAGTKGARVSVNSKGRITKSLSIPGTGISHVSTSSLGSSKKSTKKEIPKAKTQKPQTGNFIERNQSTEPSKPPKGNKRWLAYIIIAILAAMISVKLFYPTLLLEGISHLLYIQKNCADQPNKKKRLQTTSVALLFFTCATMITSFSAPKIETITLTVAERTMDVKQEQTVTVLCSPENADLSDLEFSLSDPAYAEITTTEDGDVGLKTFSKEGTFALLAESGDVTSTVSITVVDEQKQRDAEKKAEEDRLATQKKAEEERIAAEKKVEEDRIATEEKAKAEASAKNTSSSKGSASQSPTVYVTPSGKRYHYNSSCNGGSYHASTLNDAENRGLTPCNKCAG